MTISIQQLMKQVEDVRDRFYDAVYLEGDVDAAQAVAAPDCEVHDLPSSRGARSVQEHLGLPRPADARMRRLSRTGDRWRVADEFSMSFTHDREVPWLLPGLAATHRSVEVFAMSFVTVSKGRVVSSRTLWDVHDVAGRLEP